MMQENSTDSKPKGFKFFMGFNFCAGDKLWKRPESGKKFKKRE
jgi:hypothetical protein